MCIASLRREPLTSAGIGPLETSLLRQLYDHTQLGYCNFSPPAWLLYSRAFSFPATPACVHLARRLQAVSEPCRPLLEPAHIHQFLTSHNRLVCAPAGVPPSGSLSLIANSVSLQVSAWYGLPKVCLHQFFGCHNLIPVDVILNCVFLNVVK